VKTRLVHLDCLRGLAALLVCIEHLRAFLFLPFAQVRSPNLLERVFYFVTGLGHQAVMIFFVLSGFLVGGSVISAHQNGKWSWSGYALRRLTRLWMVLIPALMLTSLWDQLGRHQSPAGYDGAFHALYNSGPAPDAPADLRPGTFLGNSLFLQTIYVNCFGTNGPLWSLANEFWYYLLFPLLLGVFLPQSNSEALKTEIVKRKNADLLKRLLCAVLAAGALWLLPGAILWGGLVWLMGAGVFALIQNERIRSWATQPLWLAGSGLLALALLGASRMDRLGGEDGVLLGLGFALLVAGLAVRSAGPGVYTRISAGASEFSYTLYLVHFPLLAFLFFSVFKGHQLPPGIHSALWFTGVLMAVLIYAAAIWWCFERNTDHIRKQVGRLIG
jgi:peptidoglycan/LPS O-acetylase OafA/YrhL